MISRKWPVLVGATFGVVAGYWIVMAGILAAAGGSVGSLPNILIGAGLAVLAATVVASAVATGRDPIAGVAAAAIGGGLLALVWLVRADEVPLPALAAGVGLAAALAVNRMPAHLLWVRILMAVVVFAYVQWVTFFSAGFAILITPLLPYPTVGLADFASERDEQRRSRSSYAASR